MAEIPRRTKTILAKNIKKSEKRESFRGNTKLPASTVRRVIDVAEPAVAANLAKKIAKKQQKQTLHKKKED